MHHALSHLLLYRGVGECDILAELGGVFRAWESGTSDRDELTGRIYDQIRRLLDLAMEYGFQQDLWQCYLTWLLLTNENPFTRTCEREEAEGGSVAHFARNDLAVFHKLFHFDFTPIEKDLGIDCFSAIRNDSDHLRGNRTYDRDVSRHVNAMRLRLDAAGDEGEMFSILTGHYREYGAGVFAMNRAFRVRGSVEEGISFEPVRNIEGVMLDDLVGCEPQKKELRSNTEAFLEGRRANNVLLYGDAGTGKSTSVKSLVNEYYDRGLRIIEIYKHQFRELGAMLGAIKDHNYRFIVFIDDLSFEENEVEHKFLKAIIEGGMEARPDNALIYATSNRRHLVRETWNDRNDVERSGDVHRSDTMEEKLSLASRFGVSINYSAPTQRGYQRIVLALAERSGITMAQDKLLSMANIWEIRHGGFSGRVAQQFIQYIEGLPQE
jgi:predicted AAA+ superfamily ATPase